MIIEEITNKQDGTSLSVTECGIHIEDWPEVSIHYAFEDSIEILWLISKLKNLHQNMVAKEKANARMLSNSKKISPSEVKDNFTKIRQMLTAGVEDNL